MNIPAKKVQNLLFVFQKLSFEDGEFKFRDQKWVKQELITYGRIDSSVTDADILRALDGNIKRKRIYSNLFSDTRILKYRYDIKYIQPVKKYNPFETDEYKNIQK